MQENAPVVSCPGRDSAPRRRALAALPSPWRHQPQRVRPVGAAGQGGLGLRLQKVAGAPTRCSMVAPGSSHSERPGLFRPWSAQGWLLPVAGAVGLFGSVPGWMASGAPCRAWFSAALGLSGKCLSGNRLAVQRMLGSLTLFRLSGTIRQAWRGLQYWAGSPLAAAPPRQPLVSCQCQLGFQWVSAMRITGPDETERSA